MAVASRTPATTGNCGIVFGASGEIDADTGMPIRFIGGDQGQTPSVVVDYQVTRVTTADIANG